MATFPVMIRLPPLAAGAVLCALLGADNASAYSGFGTAVVQDRAGLPCFGLPSRTFESIRSPRMLQALTVYRRDTEKTWSFMYHTNPAEPLIPGQCIAYGALPPSAMLLEPPQPLVPGILYEVYLNAPTNGPISGYTAKFCLKSAPDGAIRVIPIRYDKHAGWSAAACQS